MKDSIRFSIFDIFKTGPGPSSSHTIGPMKAALEFRQAMEDLQLKDAGDKLVVDVHLYGSLSLTGEGHGTHKAVLGGLMGWEPHDCDCDVLTQLLEKSDQTYGLPLGKTEIPFTSKNIHFEGQDIEELPHANTLRFFLRRGKKLLLEKEYYSIGGGFIHYKGEIPVEPPEAPHVYWNMNSFRKLMRKTNLTLPQIMLENEAAITGLSEKQILARLDQTMAEMEDSVKRGLAKDGVLPGTIGLLRKAKVLFENTHELQGKTSQYLARLNAYAMAASEENADGQRVVTAPTSGSAGVIPGILSLLKNDDKLSRDQLREGMLAAALIAFISKKNASISGAEVGCQGEVGVASAMAAALMAQAMGATMKQVENAAEIALEHQLGMTCDPVGGYVQIPCIERNAVGAVTAVNAYILAEAGDPARPKVTFDEGVVTMMETGRDMCSRY
ncbi:MAG: L-serine ammonia-lyase, partial [Desulfobacterales bacterium]|nr:L-serine ammonia-lyase [Desulfobacterales bacterium]